MSSASGTRRALRRASLLTFSAPISHLNMHACRRSASTVVRTLSTSASTSAGSSYNPPLKSGVLPAYDHALEYIAQDRKQKLEQLEKLQRDQSGTNKEQLEKLEVEAWANDPETRWRAKTGNGK